MEVGIGIGFGKLFLFRLQLGGPSVIVAFEFENSLEFKQRPLCPANVCTSQLLMRPSNAAMIPRPPEAEPFLSNIE